MGTDWDAADDDLEKLLEIDDLDTVYAVDIGKKAVPPITSSADAAPVSTRDPQQANSDNHSPFPAQQHKQATEDHDSSESLGQSVHLSSDSGKSTRPKSGGSWDEEPTFLETRGTICLGQDIESSSRKRERAAGEVASSDSLRSFEDAVNYGNLEPKLRVGADFLESVLNAGGAEDPPGEPELRVLSCAPGAKRSPEAANLGSRSPQGHIVQGSKRTCSDRNAEGLEELDGEPDLRVLSCVPGAKRFLEAASPKDCIVQSSKRICSDRNAAGVEDLAREPELRVLSCVPGAKRSLEASNVRMWNPRELTVQVDKRICNDRNGQAERLRIDALQSHEFNQRRANCARVADPVDRSSRHLEPSTVSSRRLPEGQEAAESRDGGHFPNMESRDQGQNASSERETSSSPPGVAYKIPGPAGAFQTKFRKKATTTHDYWKNGEKSAGPGCSRERSSVGAHALVFTEGPWLAAMELLHGGDCAVGKLRPGSLIGTIKSTNQRIPQLVGVIKEVIPNGFGDMFVTLQDLTGTVKGSLHRRVLTELEDGQLIVPGAVIILRKVTVFSPNPWTHYLNITINNVDQIFGKDTQAPSTTGNASNDNSRNSNSSTQERDHSTLQTVLDDMTTFQAAPREDYGLEPIAPDFSILDREQGAHVNHTGVDISRNIRASTPSRKSPGSGRKTRKSPALPTILEETVGLEKYSAVGNGMLDALGRKNLSDHFEAEAKATQEALAKAAGWDLSEDVELLLNDDFCFPS